MNKKNNHINISLNYTFDHFDERIADLEKLANYDNSKELKALFDDILSYKQFVVSACEILNIKPTGQETKFQSARPLQKSQSARPQQKSQSARPLPKKLKNTRSAYIVISKDAKLIVADTLIKNVKVWNKDHTYVLSNSKRVKSVSIASSIDKAPALFQNIERAKEALALANKVYDKNLFHVEEVKIDK